tara:strand:- start:720 stop:1400 length:681 start_codon:yes stop_codon:yes gene_type:complete
VADVILHLVDRNKLDEMMGMSVLEISEGMEKAAFRSYRPDPDARFHRDFDVDLEGEILELIDSAVKSPTEDSVTDWRSDSATELSVLLARWCSTGQWRCWEARLFLYVEPMLSRAVSGSEDFLLPETWKSFSDSLSRTDRSSYSESVVLDWMSRREGMGETMEPSEDPRILPTMESHRSLTESLFSFLDHYRKSDLQLLVGREFLDPGEWNLGGTSLSQLRGDLSG